MTARSPIIAGKAVIVIQLQDTIDASLATIKSKLKKFSSSIGSIGLDLFSGGLLGTLPIGKFLNDFKTFEDKILFLSTKLDGTGKEVNDLEKKIRSLGRSTSFTAAEVADAATVLGQAGFTAKEVGDSLQATLDLARGAQISLSQSGEILANTIRTFGYETSKASEIASQFNVAAKLGTLDVIDLKESIKELSGTARSLNIDLPTTLALLTQMASRSLRGTKAGTSLNTALLNIAGKADVLKKVLGVDVQDKQGNLVNIVDILDKVYKSLSKLGNVKRTKILQTLFNIRGGRAVTALDEIKSIVDLTKKIRTAGNEARDASVKMDSGFGGSLRRATSALNDFSISLGKLEGGPVGRFLQTVPSLIFSMQMLAEANPEVTLTLLAIPPAALLAGAGLLGLSYITGKLAAIVGASLGVFRSLGSFVGGQFVKGINLAVISTNRLQRALRNIDRGLSAALLTPQRIQRGSTAGKIKPTSFVKRVGATNLTGSGTAIATGIDVIQAHARFTLANYINSGAVRYFAKQKITPLVKPITSFVTRVLTSAGKSINTFGKRKAFINPFQLFRGLTSPKYASAIATKGAVGFENIVNKLFGKLGNPNTPPPFLAFFEKIGARFNTVFNGILTTVESKGTRISQKLAVFFNQFGNVKKAPPFLKFFEAIPAFFARLSSMRISGPTKLLNSLIFGAGKTKVLGTLGGALLRIGTILRLVFDNGIRLVATGLIQLTKIDIVHILFSIAKGGWAIAKAFTAVGLFTLKTLTTLSGWGNILTILLLVGPHIDFIRNAFSRLASGIGKAFGRIGDIFKQGFGLQIFGEAFASLMRGDGVSGIAQLGQAFTALGQIISTNLTLAWTELVDAIAPAYDFMRKLISSTIELGKLFGSVFGSAFGATFSGIGDLFSGGGLGGHMSSFLSEITGQLTFSMQDIFKGIGAFFVGLGTQIAFILQGVYNIVANTMVVLQDAAIAFFNLLPKAWVGEAGKAAAIRIAGPEQMLMGESLGFKNIMALQQSIDTTNATFNALPEKMMGMLDPFNKTIDAIGKSSTEQENNRLRIATEAANQGARFDAVGKAEDANRFAKNQNRILARTVAQPLGAAIAMVLSNPTKFLSNIPSQIAGGAASLGGISIGKKGATIAQIGQNAIASTLGTKKGRQAVIGGLLIEMGRYGRLNKGLSREINNLTRGKAFLFPGSNAQARLDNVLKQRAANTATRKEIKDRIQQLRRAGINPHMLQFGSVANITAAIAGDIRTTRRNLVNLSGKSTGQQTVEELQKIGAAVGEPGTPYLKSILEKVAPPTLK